ncbi:DUF1801 domain-containing protein [Candidatus Saccharibacteria bacterium]|nr:DUF1801 domain-containing protein [Candidatus Saccharibacteria bacterium]
MNMFKPTKANTTEDYLAQLPEDRRQILEKLDELIRKNAPNLKPVFSYNMPGYGAFKYTNYKKEVIDWPAIAIASQKNYVSLYVCAVEDNEYIAEKYKDDLGKVSVGKSCIRFKKLDDLNMDTLVKVIKLAAQNPGFPDGQ